MSVKPVHFSKVVAYYNKQLFVHAEINLCAEMEVLVGFSFQFSRGFVFLRSTVKMMLLV